MNKGLIRQLSMIATVLVIAFAVCVVPVRRTSAAPTVGGVSVIVSCDTSALINFNTSVPAHAYIEYGTTNAYGSATLDDTVRFYKEHAIQLTGLTAGIEYHYRIVATGGGVTTTTDQTFQTESDGNDCPAQPVQVDTRMPDMSGAVERTVKSSGGHFTPAQFQDALDEAKNATGKRTITVDAGLTITGNFTLGVKADNEQIIVRSSAHSSLTEGKRTSPADASNLFKIVTSNTVAPISTSGAAHHWRFIGAEITIQSSALADAPGGFSQSGLVRIGTASETAESQWPHHIIFDRCYIHGQPFKNTTRGVYGNGTEWAVIDSYLSDFHDTGSDAQAILSGQGRRVKIVNNYIEGAGENFMSGGVDHTVSPVTTPSDFEFTHNYVAWKQSWKWNDPTADGAVFTADAATDTLTSTAHGNTSNYAPVRLRSTGTLPAPLAAGTDYFVRSTTTNTLKLGPKITFTANASTNTFTATAHGMPNGLEIRVGTNDELPSPLGDNTNYYIVNQTANTFQLATSVGGAAIDITDTGSGTHHVRGGNPINITGAGSGSHYLLIDWVTKNHFEIKTGKKVLVFANVFDKWWSSEQTGGSIAIKSSDNDKDPTVVSKDITWFRNHHQNLGSGIAINGSNWSDEESTDWTRNVWFIHNLLEINGDVWDDEDSGNSSAANVTHIGPSVVSPTFRKQYPDGLRLVHNTFTNANAAQSSRQIHAFGEIPTTDGKAENFVVKDNVFGYGIFGIKCDSTAEGTTSLDAITNSATRTWSINLIAGSGTNYPTGNHYEPGGFTDVKFVSMGNGLGGNYRLAADSVGKNAASDNNTDIGANIDALERATESTIDGDWPTTGGGGSEDVVWTGLENATATGSSLQKTGGTSTDLDAGGYSTQSIVSGDGYVEFKKPSTSTEILIALSSDYDPSYGDSAYDYTIVANSTGWAIYENGVYQTDGASVANNDVFKIEISSGVVRYYRNGSLIDTSSQTVVYPVKLVCSIKTPSAQITEAKIISTGGPQNTVWTGLENATATGSSLQKTGGTSTDLDAGGYSTQSIVSGDGYVEFKKPSTSTEILIALSSDYDPSYGDSAYDYTIVANSSGWAIYENGAYQTDGASVANNDVFKIEISSGVVRYYRNGSLIDTSSQTVVYPVKLVCSIKTPNGSITEAKITQ